jgi:hypothetical protein
MEPVLLAQGYLEQVSNSGLMVEEPDWKANVPMSQYLRAVVLLRDLITQFYLMEASAAEVSQAARRAMSVLEADVELHRDAWKFVADLIEPEVGLQNGSVADAVYEGVRVLVNQKREARGEEPISVLHTVHAIKLRKCNESDQSQAVDEITGGDN